jgi:carbon monoxide dehydrogenase subunit G
MRIEGKKVTINSDQQKVFDFLADFNNIGSLMPDQVKEWESDEETCSFKITGIGKIKMRYLKKESPTLIEMGPGGNASLNFSLVIKLHEEDGKTIAKGEVDADLNPMLAMMAKRPLENLINEITSKLNQSLK